MSTAQCTENLIYFWNIFFLIFHESLSISFNHLRFMKLLLSIIYLFNLNLIFEGACLSLQPKWLQPKYISIIKISKTDLCWNLWEKVLWKGWTSDNNKDTIFTSIETKSIWLPLNKYGQTWWKSLVRYPKPSIFMTVKRFQNFAICIT